MQRPITVALGCRDVIFEATHDHGIFLVDDTERTIARRLILNDDAESHDIRKLFHFDLLPLHLAPDRIRGFLPPLNGHFQPACFSVSVSSPQILLTVSPDLEATSSSREIMMLRIEASTTAKALSSSSCWKCDTPTRSARGAKIDSVSCAILRRLAWSAMKSIVRMLCVRSASLTSRTRISSLIASSSLRKFSACLFVDCISRRVSFVTPSTRRAISAPNSRLILSRRHSCLRPHHAAMP